jgi:Ca2+-binding EF-hand superfamily protein
MFAITPRVHFFLNPPNDQLCVALKHAGLGLSDKEAEVLAAGFASDGKGRISVDEFHEAVRRMPLSWAST